MQPRHNALTCTPCALTSGTPSRMLLCNSLRVNSHWWVSRTFSAVSRLHLPITSPDTMRERENPRNLRAVNGTSHAGKTDSLPAVCCLLLTRMEGSDADRVRVTGRYRADAVRGTCAPRGGPWVDGIEVDVGQHSRASAGRHINGHLDLEQIIREGPGEIAALLAAHGVEIVSLAPMLNLLTPMPNCARCGSRRCIRR